MSYIAAGAIVVAAVSLVNLVLTLGVIRRLREHTELLSRRTQGPTPDELTSMLTRGETPAEFAATAEDGGVVTNENVAEHSLVAFMSTGCDACHQQLPQFVSYAEEFAGGRDATVVVVVGTGEVADEMIATLQPLARVVREEHEGPITKAFGVIGFPAYAVLDGGTVRASGYRVDQLPAATHAV